MCVSCRIMRSRSFTSTSNHAGDVLNAFSLVIFSESACYSSTTRCWWGFNSSKGFIVLGVLVLSRAGFHFVRSSSV